MAYIRYVHIKLSLYTNGLLINARTQYNGADMMNAVSTIYNPYSQFCKDEWTIINILKKNPSGLFAEDIYAYFRRKWYGRNALHHLANKKIVYNENFRWYLQPGANV